MAENRKLSSLECQASGVLKKSLTDFNRRGEVVVGTALVAVRLRVRTGTSPVATLNFSPKRFFQQALWLGVKLFENNQVLPGSPKGKHFRFFLPEVVAQNYTFRKNGVNIGKSI
jgi:hypothetical protein